MVDRIKSIMEYEEMTSAHFADYIDIGRAVMSHILNGRNKPSLEVVTRILAKIDYIDPNWLLTGEGTMLKKNFPQKTNAYETKSEQPMQRDLFGESKQPENEILSGNIQGGNVYRKENELRQPQIDVQKSVNQEIEYSKKEEKKITKIIIYYSDNTFETFNPEKIEPLKK
jgi:transcriptional regulator with XRE-family HTH domain